MKKIDKLITFSILVVLCGILTLSLTPFIRLPFILVGVHTSLPSWLIFGYLVFWSYRFSKFSVEGVKTYE